MEAPAGLESEPRADSTLLMLSCSIQDIVANNDGGGDGGGDRDCDGGWLLRWRCFPLQCSRWGNGVVIFNTQNIDGGNGGNFNGGRNGDSPGDDCGDQ